MVASLAVPIGTVHDFGGGRPSTKLWTLAYLPIFPRLHHMLQPSQVRVFVRAVLGVRCTWWQWYELDVSTDAEAVAASSAFLATVSPAGSGAGVNATDLTTRVSN